VFALELNSVMRRTFTFRYLCS